MKKMNVVVMMLGMFVGAQSFAAVLYTMEKNCRNKYPIGRICEYECWVLSNGFNALVHDGPCVLPALFGRLDDLDPNSQVSCPDFTTSTESSVQSAAETSCKAYIKRINP